MYLDEYVKSQSSRRTALLLKDSINGLAYIKRIVFDCDGVLVDIRNSYDLTIIETLEYIFKPVGLKARIGRSEIERLRFTGLYNNDWDTTYALSVLVFSSLSSSSRTAVNCWLRTGTIIESEEGLDGESLMSRFDTFLRSLKNDPTKDVEECARTVLSERGSSCELDEFLGLLNWPNIPSRSLLVKLFDSRYYGRPLYERIYGEEPPLPIDHGLIENEKLLVSEDTLAKLTKHVESPLLMITGRSRIGVEHVLGSLAKHFDMDSSVFIEDLMRHDLEKANNLKKPSPYYLIELAGGLKTLYVGDSAEDMQMVELANRALSQILFAGVIGFKEDRQTAEKYFMAKGADMIVETVEDLSAVLSHLSSGESR